MSFRPRRALVGLVTALAALALPAVASAAITPALTLDQTAGTTAGSSPAIGFNATFSPNPPTDSVKDLSIALPPGLLANEAINGGACLGSQTPNSACQVGSGTVTTGAGPAAVTLDLVAPPKTGDVGGLALIVGGTQASTADITLGATGLTVAFSNLPALGISAMNVTFTNLRLPTSCPTPAANVSLTADSYGDPTAKTATAPLTVTGCASLPYAPKLSAAITKDTSGSGATVVTEITQAANESSSKTIVLQLPKGLAPNVQTDIPCLTGQGAGCVVGTATATSPLVPSAVLSNGTVTLSGSATAPTIAIAFPALGITIPGTVSLTNNSVTFPTVPDVPLTDLKLTITGPASGGKAFNTDCAPANIGGTFTPWSGTSAVSVTSKIAFTNCALKPTASGSTGGLGSGHPKLKFKITHGQGAANVAAVTIGLPGGLKFSRSAFVKHRTCTTLKNKKKKCTTTTLIKGLGIAGAKAKTVAIKNGRLVVTLKRASGRLTITVGGPLVSETSGLQSKVKKHKTKTLNFGLKVTDAKHTATTLSLKLRAH